jgi:fructoselysine-6-P-deglycase FrlB-like protein
MQKNFDLLLARIIDSNNTITTKELISILHKIKHSCICIGTGGSHAVSQYASKIISLKNNIISLNKEPRDTLYENFELYKNICAFTYGGNNEGINKALDMAGYYKLNRYAFTSDDNKLKYTLINKNKDFIINYGGNIKKEHSFISIASTLIPISILLRYYLELSDKDFFELLCDTYLDNYNNKIEIDADLIKKNNITIEIMTGDNTYTASKILESNMVESGLLNTIVHEKYSYCHGRSTLAYNNNNKILIYLINGPKKELDVTLLNELNSLYEQIIILESNKEKPLVGEFDLSIKVMFLSKIIAEIKNKDLSNVEYAPQVKKLYRYKGGM